MPVLRILEIPVQRQRGHIFALLPHGFQRGPHIAGYVLQIPLIHQRVDLACFFVGGVVCVRMVHKGEEPDAPFREFPVQAKLGQLCVPREPCLRFHQQNFKLPLFRRTQHLVEGRTVTVRTGPVFVHINAHHVIALLQCKVQQHGFLVLDALRFIDDPFIFIAQAAINGCFHLKTSK